MIFKNFVGNQGNFFHPQQVKNFGECLYKYGWDHLLILNDLLLCHLVLFFAEKIQKLTILFRMKCHMKI